MEQSHMLSQQTTRSQLHDYSRSPTVIGTDSPNSSSSSPSINASHSPPSLKMQASSPSAHAQLPPINLSLPPISLSSDDSTSSVLPPIQLPHEKPGSASGQTLPSLSSLTGALSPPSASATTPSASPSTSASVTTAPSTTATTSPPPPQHWPSLNPFTAYYVPSHVQNPEPPMRKEYAPSHQRGTSVSLDDPGVRAAAEALGRLRTVDTTPHDRDARRHLTPDSFHVGSPGSIDSNHEQQNPKHQEPLLSLITTSYPSIAPFAPYIESATSACNTAYIQSKNYSPVIKRNAEYLEDRVVKPVAKTVGNISGPGLRWWLQKPGRKQRQHDRGDDDRQGGVKRRKADQGDRESAIAARVLADFDNISKDRRTSVSTIDTLPAYDENRSPAYTETPEGPMPPTNGAPPAGTKLWVVTSGLGVAMKDESKKKMRTLIQVLTVRNGQVSEFLGSLTKALEEYDGTAQSTNQDTVMSGQEEQNRSELTNRIQWLIGSIHGTTKTVVDVVDKQAASVLPTNVKRVVHGCLMSLPAQFKLMAQQEPPERPHQGQNSNDEGTLVRNNAHKALLLAKASLRMMTQITDVLNMTLTSAEEWCQKQESEKAAPSPMMDYESSVHNGDVKMSG